MEQHFKILYEIITWALDLAHFRKTEANKKQSPGEISVYIFNILFPNSRKFVVNITSILIKLSKAEIENFTSSSRRNSYKLSSRRVHPNETYFSIRHPVIEKYVSYFLIQYNFDFISACPNGDVVNEFFDISLP